MRVYQSAQIREADDFTILYEPISSIDLMERASRAFVDALLGMFPDEKRFTVFCGNGNNGGDGLAIARMLHESGFQVDVFLLEFLLEASPDYLVNKSRLGFTARMLGQENNEELPEVSDGILVDALLGTGTNRPAGGNILNLIQKINVATVPVVSVDIPSGMPADGISGTIEPWVSAMVRADFCISFQFPKPAFLFPETGDFAGVWSVIDIGIHPGFEPQTNLRCEYVTDADLKGFLPERARFSHKGNYGHVLIVGGSETMAGSVIISAEAAMRAGAGKVTVAGAKQVHTPLLSRLPDCMFYCSGISVPQELPSLQGFDALLVGPGMGRGAESEKLLKRIIQDWRGPLILDADALFLLAQNPTWIHWLVPGTLLTPHPGELAALLGGFRGTWPEMLDKALDLCRKTGVFINAKSAYSCLLTPTGGMLYNSSGTSALSKAGSGDVLAGITAGWMGMGLGTTMAATAANFIHGKAARLAVEKNGNHHLLASDIPSFIGNATRELIN